MATYVAARQELAQHCSYGTTFEGAAKRPNSLWNKSQGHSEEVISREGPAIWQRHSPLPCLLRQRRRFLRSSKCLLHDSTTKPTPPIAPRTRLHASVRKATLFVTDLVDLTSHANSYDVLYYKRMGTLHEFIWLTHERKPSLHMGDPIPFFYLDTTSDGSGE